jgi:hypothetical protein
MWDMVFYPIVSLSTTPHLRCTRQQRSLPCFLTSTGLTGDLQSRVSRVRFCSSRSNYTGPHATISSHKTPPTQEDASPGASHDASTKPDTSGTRRTSRTLSTIARSMTYFIPLCPRPTRASAYSHVLVLVHRHHARLSLPRFRIPRPLICAAIYPCRLCALIL